MMRRNRKTPYYCASMKRRNSMSVRQSQTFKQRDMLPKKQKKTGKQTPVFHQYKPHEVYRGAKMVEERSRVSPQKEIVKRNIIIEMHKTGNEPFDIWLQNIALHGFRNRTFHAQQLGITVPMLNGLVLALTGMLYADFVRELTYVIAKDLTRSQHYRFLNQVAEFLGYKAYSSLFRLIKQKENASPTRLTRMNNPEEQLII